MSDILIKGIGMPTDCALLLKIFPDGSVGVPVHLNWAGTMVVNDAEAVPVQPHGRLIDADAFAIRIEEEAKKFVAMNEYDSGLRTGYRAAIKAAKLAPTIIPAEPPKEE